MDDEIHYTMNITRCVCCKQSLCTSVKKNHYILSSQLGADQMPGRPRKVQVTCELFLDRHQ